MPADYVSIDNSGALISPSFPYSRFFTITTSIPLFQPPSGTAYLILTVKTGYSDPSENANVVINGTVIGVIEPRPWTNHFVIDVETIIFQFSNTLFQPFFFQDLQIVPQGNLADPSNFLLLGDAICHYRTSL